MKPEQEPTLGQLESRLAGFDHALRKVRSVRDQLKAVQDIRVGRQNYLHPAYDLSQPETRMKAVIRRGEAVISINQKTLPKLEADRRSVTESIQAFENTRDSRRIEELLRQGAIEPELGLLVGIQPLTTLPQVEENTDEQRKAAPAVTEDKPQTDGQEVEGGAEPIEPELAEEAGAPEGVEKSYLTQRQIAILCTEVQRKNGCILRYGRKVVVFKVDDPCLDVCQRLDAQQVNLARAEFNGIRDLNIQKEREEALGAMRDLVKDIVNQDSQPKREENGSQPDEPANIFDALPEDMKHLVIQFLEWETVLSAANLYDFLSSLTEGNNLEPGDVGYDEACVREFKGSTKVWDVPHPFPEKEPEVTVAVIPQENQTQADLILTEPEDAVAVSLKEDVGNVLASPVGITQTSIIFTNAELRKQMAAQRKEQADQLIKDRVRSCLEKINQALLQNDLPVTNHCQWGGAVINRVFNRLTQTMTEKLIEKKIIKPFIRNSHLKGGAAELSVIGLAVALYYCDEDRQITAKLARELEKVVTEEINAGEFKEITRLSVSKNR